MTHLVLVPLGDRFLGLTGEEFKAALARGRLLDGTTTTPAGANGDAPECLLTAEEMEKRTKVPATWFLEAARRGEIPHVRLGKYRRFQLDEVLACSRFQERVK
jgi:excisionase family DNA binding protein